MLKLLFVNMYGEEKGLVDQIYKTCEVFRAYDY